jgi:hypothetical protein
MRTIGRLYSHFLENYWGHKKFACIYRLFTINILYGIVLTVKKKILCGIQDII